MGKNHLGKEKSPYLLQHKDNPVWWYSWGPEAFEAARSEKKLIFLSIGYSTCHWCHVMEHDSFEKQDVADILNKNYISIKIDREEHPDIDAIYMSAVQAINGSGGWPLSALLTDDGKPFWGGTFLPHDNFIYLLNKVEEVWKENPKEITESSQKLGAFLKEHSDLDSSQKLNITEKPLIDFYNTFRSRFDEIHGGQKGAPKFPSALAMSLLLRIHRRASDQDMAKNSLYMVTKTLDEMRRGGIYDQVGGGFHRYSVDDHWEIPHFEKMLYDNALLTVTYLEAFQLNQNPDYAQTATETLDYVLREMTDSRGGFFSAEDADSEGVEGKYYVWTEDELQKILKPEDYALIKKTFNITPHGNYEEKNHFYLKSQASLPKLNKTLLDVRGKRIHPHLDDKILTSWNGLMISAFAKGYQVLGEKRFLEAAKRSADFILKSMKDKNGQLVRRYRDGDAGKPGLAEDYAFFIEALLNLYESDFELKYFEAAMALQKIQDHLFWDKTNGAYFDNDGKDALVIARNKNFEDNVVPSSNGVSANNLLRLFALTGDLEFQTKAKTILDRASLLISKYPQATPKGLQAVDRLTDKSYEVAIVSKGNATEEIKTLHENFFPNHTFAIKTENTQNIPPLLENRTAEKSQTTFYLCEGQKCLLPTTDFKSIQERLSEPRFFDATLNQK
jgi:uncharacterized protein